MRSRRDNKTYKSTTSTTIEPNVTEELLNYLEKYFGRYTSKPSEDEATIRYKSGQKSVHDHFVALYLKQQGDAYKEVINVQSRPT